MVKNFLSIPIPTPELAGIKLACYMAAPFSATGQGLGSSVLWRAPQWLTVACWSSLIGAEPVKIISLRLMCIGF